jgi:hypothetical protein
MAQLLALRRHVVIADLDVAIARRRNSRCWRLPPITARWPVATSVAAVRYGVISDMICGPAAAEWWVALRLRTSRPLRIT